MILGGDHWTVQFPPLKTFCRLDVPNSSCSFEGMIRLHVLGAGGAVPTASHGPAAYWVEIDGQGLLLDPGPGALVRLLRQPGTVDEIDAINTVLLSHLHLDHTADLAPLLFAMHSVLARSTTTLHLYGPPGTADFLAQLKDLYGTWLTPHGRALVLDEVSPGSVIELSGGGRAVAHAAAHEESNFGAPCLGWTFQDSQGARLVYSGDTGPCEDLTTAARGCDLLLVECTTPDDLAVAGHLAPEMIVELVRNTHPRRVVLTHLYPLVVNQAPELAVTAATEIPCTAARDGDTFTVEIES